MTQEEFKDFVADVVGLTGAVNAFHARWKSNIMAHATKPEWIDTLPEDERTAAMAAVLQLGMALEAFNEDGEEPEEPETLALPAPE